MALFENVVAEYDAGRPEYPAAIYEALGPLAGVRVLDVGAGTGIATRELLRRGASVIAVDAGPAMIAYAKQRSPELEAVAADGARLPIVDASVDLVCFAQSWHWLDESTRIDEMRRVLAAGGRWAAWWSHARDVGEGWYDAYWQIVEQACPGTHRSQAETDWSRTITADGTFAIVNAVAVQWTRAVSVDDWITDQSSHSYIASMALPQRAAVLDRLRGVCDDAFPTGAMQVPFVTRLWVAEAVTPG